MRKTISVAVLSVVLCLSTVPLASTADAVTCFDDTGHATPCAPITSPECYDAGAPMPCDPCYFDKAHAAFVAEYELMRAQVYPLKELIHRQAVRLRERRAKIWFLRRKVHRQAREIRHLRAELAAAAVS